MHCDNLMMYISYVLDSGGVGLMVSELDSGLSSVSLSPGRGMCCVSWTHGASICPGVSKSSTPPNCWKSRGGE